MHQTRAGVAQIVKADLAQTVALKYLWKSVLDVARLEAVSHLVGEHVVNVLHIVAVAADLAVSLLHLAPSKQLFAHCVRHGKASVARLGLGAVGGNDNGFAVHTRLCDRVVDGDPVPQDILRILGQKALATFMVEQIQQVYRLQGVVINDKHIEILIREMTRRVEITNPGDTGFLMGQVVDRVDFEEENARVARDNGKLAEASQVLVGLTRASLTSRSFISNASFQQTTKVLVDAAISGSTDKLVGINENLIVGRLIPIGTGAYVRRVREIAKEEEKAERLAREGNGQQQLLDI